MENKKILQGIDTVMMRVSDINNSKQWYQDKLGLTTIWDDPNLKLVVLDTGSPTSLTLWQTDKKIENNKDTSCYSIFRTDSANYAWEDLNKNGVKVSQVIEDNVVKYFQIYDPDGNVLEACQVHE
jgi:catechol 2,3-dioxygenase-like lactoylglutathione lyase family enzyme